MNNDLNATPSCGNVFADLGMPNAEEHLLKAQVVLMIGNAIKARNMPQVAAARIIGVSQPDISKILRGRFEGFSLERLFSFLMLLGCEIEVKVSEPPANENYAPGHLRLAL